MVATFLSPILLRVLLVRGKIGSPSVERSIKYLGDSSLHMYFLANTLTVHPYGTHVIHVPRNLGGTQPGNHWFFWKEFKGERPPTAEQCRPAANMLV